MNIETQIKGYTENQPFWKEDFSANSTNSKGDDVKGAFLALLQGLVGFSGVNLSNLQVAPEAKIAKQEVVEKEKEESDVFAYSESTQKELHTSSGDASVKEEVNNSMNEVVQSNEQTEVAVENTQIQERSLSDNAKQTVVESNHSTEQVVAQTAQIESQKEVSVTNEELNKKITPEIQVISEGIAKKTNEQITTTEQNDAAKISGNIQKKSREIEYTSETQSNQIDSQQGLVQQVRVENTADQASLKTKNRKSNDSVGYSISDEKDPLDEILHSYFSEQNQDISRTVSSQQTKQEYKLIDKSNTIKDNILAKILLGVDMGGVAAQLNTKQGASELKSSVDTVLGLAQKSATDKSATEKTSNTSFIRRSALSQEFVDKVKEVLEKAAINKTNDSISVKIDPPHLGQIHVKITHKNGEIYAKLTPEHKEVEQVLKTKSHELMNVIQALGFSPNEVHIQIGREVPQELPPTEQTAYSYEQSSTERNLSSDGGNSGLSYQGNTHPIRHENLVEQKSLIVDNGWVA